METRTLKYFLSIAREENMTTAANLLHVSQSALSKQMSDLEKQLNKKLFVRTNRKTLLTEDGMRLRQRAEEIISLIEKTEMEFQSSDEDISGDIYIGAGETKAFSLIAKAMKIIQNKYPNIHFHVYSGNAIDVCERLEHATLDFGLLFEPVSKDSYEYLKIPIADTIGLIVKKDALIANKNYITEESLLDIPLLISSRLSPYSVLTNISKKNIEKLNIVARYNLLYNASLMVEQGLGNALGIDNIINTDENSLLKFIPIKPPIEMHTVFVWKKYRLLTKPQKLFLDTLKILLQK